MKDEFLKLLTTAAFISLGWYLAEILKWTLKKLWTPANHPKGRKK